MSNTSTPYLLETGEGYRNARTSLGLTQEQFALLVRKSPATIAQRERGDVAITHEAELAMRWLLANPPVSGAVVPKGWRRNLTEGETFGLFTITGVGLNNAGKPCVYSARCRCGAATLLNPSRFYPSTRCRPNCTAHAAMVARGSHVDARGDIIDKDGFPEA